MNTIEKTNKIRKLCTQINGSLQASGYWLSEEDISYLRKQQIQACKIHQMIDFDSHILFDIANTFQKSPYVRYDSFVNCIKEALYIYYGVRRRDHIRYDHEIVVIMYEQYIAHHGIFDLALLQDCIKAVKTNE